MILGVLARCGSAGGRACSHACSCPVACVRTASRCKRMWRGGSRRSRESRTLGATKSSPPRPGTLPSSSRFPGPSLRAPLPSSHLSLARECAFSVVVTERAESSCQCGCCLNRACWRKLALLTRKSQRARAITICSSSWTACEPRLVIGVLPDACITREGETKTKITQPLLQKQEAHQEAALATTVAAGEEEKYIVDVLVVFGDMVRLRNFSSFFPSREMNLLMSIDHVDLSLPTCLLLQIHNGDNFDLMVSPRTPPRDTLFCRLHSPTSASLILHTPAPPLLANGR